VTDEFAATSKTFALTALAILIAASVSVVEASAQGPVILAPGNAIVTGFSGARRRRRSRRDKIPAT
jgi:hypothetical protein